MAPLLRDRSGAWRRLPLPLSFAPQTRLISPARRQR
jgi:hypothetical protein